MIAPPVPTSTWSFIKPPGHKLIYWEASTNLTHWDYAGWTTNESVTLALTNRMGFFRFHSVPPGVSLRIPGGTNQIQPPDTY